MHLIRELERTRDETLQYFSLAEGDLARTYASGKWPIRFILHHLADSETVLFDRIRRVLSEPRQVLWVFDQEAWARGLDYSKLPLDISRRVYESVRNAVIYHAGLHYEDKGHLEFVHSVTGVRTLRDEFDKVAAHNEHHLSQIRVALGNRNRMERLLFICEHGAAKSVVAAAHFNRLAADAGLDVRAVSRGTAPDATVSPQALAGLTADGLRPVDDAPMLLTASDIATAVRIISFGAVPLSTGPSPSESWTQVPAVSDGYARARDAMMPELRRLVRELSAHRPGSGAA